MDEATQLGLVVTEAGGIPSTWPSSPCGSAGSWPNCPWNRCALSRSTPRRAPSRPAGWRWASSIAMSGSSVLVALIQTLKDWTGATSSAPPS